MKKCAGAPSEYSRLDIPGYMESGVMVSDNSVTIFYDNHENKHVVSLRYEDFYIIVKTFENYRRTEKLPPEIQDIFRNWK